MANGGMDTKSLKQLQEHPIKVILAVLVLYSGTLWTIGRPAIVEDLKADFVTTKQMEMHVVDQIQQFGEINTKLDKLISKDTRRNAYITLAAIESDIERHNKLRDESYAWRQVSDKLNDRLERAVRYKDCVMGRFRECDMLKDEIWQ